MSKGLPSINEILEVFSQTDGFEERLYLHGYTEARFDYGSYRPSSRHNALAHLYWEIGWQDGLADGLADLDREKEV